LFLRTTGIHGLKCRATHFTREVGLIRENYHDSAVEQWQGSVGSVFNRVGEAPFAGPPAAQACASLL